MFWIEPQKDGTIDLCISDKRGRYSIWKAESTQQLNVLLLEMQSNELPKPDDWEFCYQGPDPNSEKFR